MICRTGGGAVPVSGDREISSFQRTEDTDCCVADSLLERTRLSSLVMIDKHLHIRLDMVWIVLDRQMSEIFIGAIGSLELFPIIQIGSYIVPVRNFDIRPWNGVYVLMNIEDLQFQSFSYSFFDRQLIRRRCDEFLHQGGERPPQEVCELFGHTPFVVGETLCRPLREMMARYFNLNIGERKARDAVPESSQELRYGFEGNNASRCRDFYGNSRRTARKEIPEDGE